MSVSGRCHRKLVLIGIVVFPALAAAQQVPVFEVADVAAVQIKQPAVEGLTGVYQVRFSPDEKQLAVRGAVQQIDLWDWQRKKQLLTMRGHEGRIRDLQFVCNGLYLASTTDYLGEPTRIWDLTTGKTVFSLPISGRLILPLAEATIGIVAGGELHRVNLPPDDRQRTNLLTRRANAQPLASSPAADAFLFWFTGRNSLGMDYAVVDASGRPLLLTHDGIGCEPEDAAIFDGVAGQQLVLCCRREPTLQIKSLGASEFRLTKRDVHDDAISDLAVSPDGRWLATASWDGTIKVWELLTRKPIAQLEGHTDKVLCVEFSPSGQLLASGGAASDNRAIVWHLFDTLLGEAAGLAAADDSVDRHWDNLGHRDPVVAYRSLAWFMHHVDEALETSQRKLGNRGPLIGEAQLETWVRDLASDSFETRSIAYERLLEHRGAFLKQLKAAHAKSSSLESRLQLQRILEAETAQKLLTAEQRNRQARAVFLLETIGGDEAERLLEQLQVSSPSLQAHIQQVLTRISGSQRDA